MVTVGRQKKSHGRGRINGVPGQLTREYGKEGKKNHRWMRAASGGLSVVTET